MGGHEDLLRRFAPQLRYDANEQFFADSAAEWTDRSGHELRRKDGPTARGALIASADGGAPALLRLDFLGRAAYANGEAVLDGDYIGDPAPDYRAHYAALRTARPDLRNRMYGHAVQGRDRLWLQYWFWYFYNDYNLALGAGRHEGDWEMIQLRMHDEEPDLAVYAQHTRAEKRPWQDVERAPGRPDTPVVYVARGSHASYFEAGYHETDAWYDLADGKRKTPELTLEIAGDDTPPWIVWPGRWGDTRARLGGVDQPSPVGPGAHGQWTDPDRLLADAWQPRRRAAAAAPEVTVTGAGGHLRADFDFSAHTGPPPAALVITVNSGDEPGVPPRTYTFAVADLRAGRLATRIPIEATKHYDVYVSTTGGDPPVPSESALTELGPDAPEPKPGLGTRIAKALGRVVAWVRGQLR